MSILIPAIKGRLGNTDFFEATMNARDLVHSIRPPLEMDDWANFGIEERMQREPEKKRIMAQLAPYIAKNKDRFFGSIIVLIYEGDVSFEALSQLTEKLPNAYKKNASRIGFLTIDGGTLIVLDGQHRLLALRMVLLGEVTGEYAKDVVNDDICVVFIRHEEFVKTRRIFNTVNRYAKPTSRSDNILTSEDDGYAIVARRLLRDDQPLHARHTGKSTEDIVDWKSNSLAARSVKLTTISTVYEASKSILEYFGISKLNLQDRPSDDELDEYLEKCSSVWKILLTKINAYADALKKVSDIPAMRADNALTALLFKPAAQNALVDGVLRAATFAKQKMDLDQIITRVNKITDWSMMADQWRDIIVKAGGTIDTKSDARERLARLLAYLLVADVMAENAKLIVWETFNGARHPEAFAEWKNAKETGLITKTVINELEDLPIPTAGKCFKVADACRLSNVNAK